MDEWRIIKFHSPFLEPLIQRLAEKLMKDIRPCDLKDITFPGVSPETLVLSSIRATDELVIAKDTKNNLLFLAGVCNDIEGQVGRSVWMLGTNKVYQYKKSLLVEFCKTQCREWVRKYKLLTGAVHSDNVASVEWIKRIMGGTFLNDELNLCNHNMRKWFIAEGRNA